MLNISGYINNTRSSYDEINGLKSIFTNSAGLTSTTNHAPLYH